jgi:hypothetical protein
MADRKYRQQGYRSQGAEWRAPARPPGEAPPRGSMLAQKSVSRCGACGERLPIATGSLEQCPACRASIHACRQCAHFDASRHFECTEPVPERVVDKQARNDCDAFALRVSIERDASPDGVSRADARRAFDNLFKK